MSAFATSPRITPFLWFDGNAEEAVAFYLSVFPDARRLDTFHPKDDPNFPEGNVLTIDFELAGQRFIALNGGPNFHFNEAVSFAIRCDTQDEVDNYWAKLTEGGTPIQCGWLKDRFGLTWQVIPAKLPELIRKPKAMQAMMGMVKFDIAELERAAAD